MPAIKDQQHQHGLQDGEAATVTGEPTAWTARHGSLRGGPARLEGQDENGWHVGKLAGRIAPEWGKPV